MIFLGKISGLPDPGATSVTIGEGAAALDVILIQSKGNVRAFANRCPHQGTPLETFPGRLLNEDGTLLICSTHGARFRISDGICVSGPCKGQSLNPVAFTCRPDGSVYLTQT